MQVVRLPRPGLIKTFLVIDKLATGMQPYTYIFGFMYLWNPIYHGFRGKYFQEFIFISDGSRKHILVFL